MTLVPREASDLEKRGNYDAARVSQVGQLVSSAISDIAGIFKFEEKIVQLGNQGAYSIKGGQVQAFGIGAITLGQYAGVEVFKPKRHVFDDGEEHPNPWVHGENDGEIDTYLVAVYIQPNGLIRFKDFIDHRSLKFVMTERAMNHFADKDIPSSAKRFCTREQVRVWNAAAINPKDPVWDYFDIPGSEVGVAFDLTLDHWKTGAFKKGNAEILKNFRLKAETQATVRAIRYVIGDYLTAIETQQFHSTFDGEKVQKAFFSIQAPTQGGFMMSLLHKIAIAIKEGDEAGRAQALEAAAATLNIDKDSFTMVEAAEPVHAEPTDITEFGEVIESSKALMPPPVKFNLSKACDYVRESWPLLTTDQQIEVAGLVSTTADRFSVDLLVKENIKAVLRAFSKFTSPDPLPATDGEPEGKSADEMRTEILNSIDGDSADARLSAAIAAQGLDPETELQMIPDETIKAIHAAYMETK